jgi:hypothetical protein
MFDNIRDAGIFRFCLKCLIAVMFSAGFGRFAFLSFAAVMIVAIVVCGAVETKTKTAVIVRKDGLFLLKSKGLMNLQYVLHFRVFILGEFSLVE